MLALAALVLGSEAVVREWIQSPSTRGFEPGTETAQRPHARVVQSQEGYNVSRVNSLGFMDDEPRVPRAPLRALLLGDSYAEALQVAREEDFAHVAERLLAGLEVINAGQSASFPATYAAELARLDRRLTPDLVVVQVNDGDVRELLNPALMAQVGHDRQLRDGPAQTPIAAAGLPRRFGRWLLRQSALANLAAMRFTLLEGKERARLSKKLGLGRGGYVESMSGPVAPRANAILDSLYAVMREVRRPMLFVYIPDLDYFASPPQPRFPTRRVFFRAFAARNGVPLIDPTDAMLDEYRRTRQPLQGFQNTVLGLGHLNARGHAVVGRLLADAIGEMAR